MYTSLLTDEDVDSLLAGEDDDSLEDDPLCQCTGCGTWQRVALLGREHIVAGDVCGSYQ